MFQHTISIASAQTQQLILFLLDKWSVFLAQENTYKFNIH